MKPKYDFDPALTERAAHALLEGLGYESVGEHLEDTPKRMAKALHELTQCDDFVFTAFPNTENVREMVAVQNIQFYSLCAHHVLPFFGKAHVAYLPGEKVVGISKLARAVRYFSRGLQIQEHLASEVADKLVEALNPAGVMVVMEAEHLCMSMRGAQAEGAFTVTSAVRGHFATNDQGCRDEFLALLNRSK